MKQGNIAGNYSEIEITDEGAGYINVSVKHFDKEGNEIEYNENSNANNAALQMVELFDEFMQFVENPKIETTGMVQ